MDQPTTLVRPFGPGLTNLAIVRPSKLCLPHGLPWNEVPCLQSSTGYFSISKVENMSLFCGIFINNVSKYMSMFENMFNKMASVPLTKLSKTCDDDLKSYWWRNLCLHAVSIIYNLSDNWKKDNELVRFFMVKYICLASSHMCLYFLIYFRK